MNEGSENGFASAHRFRSCFICSSRFLFPGSYVVVVDMGDEGRDGRCGQNQYDSDSLGGGHRKDWEDNACFRECTDYGILGPGINKSTVRTDADFDNLGVYPEGLRRESR